MKEKERQRMREWYRESQSVREWYSTGYWERIKKVLLGVNKYTFQNYHYPQQ